MTPAAGDSMEVRALEILERIRSLEFYVAELWIAEGEVRNLRGPRARARVAKRAEADHCLDDARRRLAQARERQVAEVAE